MYLQCPQCKNIWKSGSREFMSLNRCCPLHPNIEGIVITTKQKNMASITHGAPVQMSEKHGYYSKPGMGGKVLVHSIKNQ